MTSNSDEITPPENVGFLNFKTIGMSAVKGHKPCTLLDAARHNLREIQAELGAHGRIDAQRMADNRILAGPETAAEVVAMAEEIKAQMEKPPTWRDAVQAVEAVFPLNRHTRIDVEAYFAHCLAWVRKATSLPVLLATVHVDEEHPHLHVLLAPVKGGAYVGGALTVKSEHKKMRELFGKQVATPAGLKYGGAKFYGQAKKWATAAVLRECEARGLPGANGPLWGLWRTVIERDPTEAVRLLGIDVNGIRPGAQACDSNPIGNDSNPRGIGLAPLENQSLSCVGIDSPTPPTKAPKAPPAMPARGATPATITPATMPPTERLIVAHTAQQCAMAKHRKPGRVKAPPVVVTDPDGYTRDRGDTHDLSAWD